MTSTFVITGPRASRTGILRLGSSAVLLNETGTQVLLTKRADNGFWCLPGGRVDPGESVTESVKREFFEETKLRISIKRLVGVYSDPNLLIVYPDGNEAHIIVLCFLVERESGKISLSPETTDIRYFPVAEALQMDLFHKHAEHLRDALTNIESAFIR